MPDSFKEFIAFDFAPREDNFKIVIAVKEYEDICYKCYSVGYIWGSGV